MTSFNGGTSSYHNTVGPLTAGAVLIADWSNDVDLIAANTGSFAGYIAGLNFYPPSSDSRSDFWVAAGDGDLLMANALCFVARQAECQAVPEPAPVALMALGLLLMGFAARRRFAFA